jgi:hypothetical protein
MAVRPAYAGETDGGKVLAVQHVKGKRLLFHGGVKADRDVDQSETNSSCPKGSHRFLLSGFLEKGEKRGVSYLYCTQF